MISLSALRRFFCSAKSKLRFFNAMISLVRDFVSAIFFLARSSANCRCWMRFARSFMSASDRMRWFLASHMTLVVEAAGQIWRADVPWPGWVSSNT